MATPHVAGFAAYLLGLDSSLTPASVDSTMKSKALTGVLTGIRKHWVLCVRAELLTTFSSIWHHQQPPQQWPLNVETRYPANIRPIIWLCRCSLRERLYERV